MQNSRCEQPHVHVQDAGQQEHGQGQEENGLEAPVGQREPSSPQSGAWEGPAPPPPPAMIVRPFLLSM